MPESLEDRFERHRRDPFAHGELREHVARDVESIMSTANARFLEVELRIGRLEKFQWWLTGVGSAIGLMAGGGLVAAFSGHWR